jgi:hypothetical protein
MARNRSRSLNRNTRLAYERHGRSLKRKNKRYQEDPEYAKIAKKAVPEWQRTSVNAPEDFSLTTNRAEVLEYLEVVSSLANKREYGVMHLGPIKSTDMPTICLVMSLMKDKRSLFGRYIMIRYPNEKHPMGQFFETIQFRQTIDRNTGLADHNLFLSRTETDVNMKAKKDIIKKSREFFGTSADLSSLNPILTEMMSNTANHADPDKADDEPNRLPWLAAMMPLPEGNRMRYCVVDLGIGIVEHWKYKGVEQRKKIPVIDNLFKESQGNVLRKIIPEGVNSSTFLEYRGQGMRTIYEKATTGPFSDFTLITNKAMVNLTNTDENIPDTKYNFNGTIYYWEMQIG